MLPFILAAAAGGLLVKKMTDYPAEIRNIRKQMSKDEQKDFLRDYKALSNDSKTQFKKYLREANLVEASKIIGKDLSSYSVKAAKNTKTEKKTDLTLATDAAANGDNGFSQRIRNILNSYQLDSDPQLVSEAAKRYESIAGLNQMNIVDRTRKMLDVSS